MDDAQGFLHLRRQLDRERRRSSLPPGSIEQRLTEIFLHLFDLKADGAGRKANLLGSGDKAAAFQDRV